MSIEKKICLYTAHVVHKILKEKWFGFLFASSIVVLFLGIVANVSTPILFKNIIDQMEGHNQALMALIISYGCMWIISQASISLREYLMHAIDERSNNLVMKEVLKKLYELPITYHHQKNLGEYLNIFDRIQRNIPLLTWYTLFSIVPVLIELTATMIILLLWYPPHFSIFIALSVISFLTYTLLMTKRALIARDKAIEVNKLTSAQILDWIAQYELVKIFGRTEYVINRLSEVLDKRERTEIKALTLYDAVRAGQAIILGLGLLLVTLSVGSAVQKGTLTVGDFALFNGYLIQFMAPLDLLGYVLLSFRKSILELKDAFSILQEKSLIKDPSIVYQKITTPITIRFDHVSFTYPNNNKLALNDISFTIKQGETVVILGESGSGKSTIVRLLLRLYDPNSGTLYFNNIPSNLIGPKDLYHHIGIMTQETFLFNASLKENIIFSNPHASEQDIYHALEKAQLANFVAALPEGILTNLGKRGMQISGGEKQRIGLARLFVCNPDIAIFDEPTSALDHKTEREIIESIKTLDSKTTKIIITHKKELASLADTILYVDKGTVQQYDLDTFLKKN